MVKEKEKPAKVKLTTGQKVIKFIETYCMVPEGTNVGRPVVLAEFQRKFILDVYDNPHVTDTAILSMARKNAKTATIAFIVLAHLVGPVCIQNSRIVSGAMSREQAGEVYNLASKCVNLSPKLSDIVRVVPSSKKLIGLPMGVEYQAISAEGKTAHGKSPVVAILDEVGQIKGPQSDFVDAITTAQGAYDNPLLIYISTQAANDADFFSIQIDDALKNKPAKTVCHVYAADADCDVMDEEQWKKANPALGLFRSEKDMRKQAEKAKRMPSFENTMRNLNLNQRVAINSPFVTYSIWKNCAGELVDISQCTEFYGGLDLSGRTDLTAFVLIGKCGDKWHVFCWFWTPEIGLKERAARDRAGYDLWVRDGYIQTTPGASVDYETVAKQIIDITEMLPVPITAIAYDRWRIDILKKEFSRLEYTDKDGVKHIGVELPLQEWGQGFKDMGPALDALEEKLLNQTIYHGANPVLTMCAANSMVTKDPANNRKLDKMKTTGRIDGMQALAMAVGLSERVEGEEDINDFLNNPLKA